MLRQRLAKGIEASFAGPVGSGGWFASKRPPRGNIDDPSAPLARHHMLGDTVGNINRPDQVDLNRLSPDRLPIRIICFDQGVLQINTGIID